MIKKILLFSLLIFISFFNSCSSNVNKTLTNMSQTDESFKITEEMLLRSDSVIVKENGIEKTKYPVIIYITDSNELENMDILIQSKSNEFVTALISPNDLKTIYNTKGVREIIIPNHENNQ